MNGNKVVDSSYPQMSLDSAYYHGPTKTSPIDFPFLFFIFLKSFIKTDYLNLYYRWVA